MQKPTISNLTLIAAPPSKREFRPLVSCKPLSGSLLPAPWLPCSAVSVSSPAMLSAYKYDVPRRSI